MWKCIQVFCWLPLALWVLGRLDDASAAEVMNMRVWTAPDNIRVVLDLTARPEYKLFKMPDGRRIVLDLSNATLVKPLSLAKKDGQILSDIRSAQRGAGDARVVFDLLRSVEIKTFAIPPGREYGHRLVVDFIDRNFARRVAVSASEPAKKPRVLKNNRFRDIIVAIDAGHGGEDPGAQSVNGTREKDIVLAIARRLAALVDAEQGMQSTLIRDGDYYVGLRERIQRARERQADLFVSIHADAFHNTQASGSSVFVLSRRGASSEAARWLANRENEADMIGGVSLDNRDDMVKAAILDISQVGVMDASSRVARKVLHDLKKIRSVHHDEVQRAGFVVLKCPDIPSILVETAFLTNRFDESRLRDGAHQQALAAAIMNGIRDYFVDGAPPGTLFAQEKERLSHLDNHSVGR